MLVAERLRSAIATVPIVAEGKPLSVTASIGVASGGVGAQSDDVVSAADAALYRAKKNGRDRVEAAVDEDWPPSAERGKPPVRTGR
jgi:diguanylate cyclase (GGDEF)-like protein